jgi:TolB protein
VIRLSLLLSLVVGAFTGAMGARAQSPYATRLAYTTEVEDQFGRRTHGLYTVDIDGTNVRMLSMQPQPIAGIDWGPTAYKLAYADSWGGPLSLWTVEPNGFDLDWFTTRDIWDDSYPSWSPDGRHIAIMSNRAGNDEIHIVQAAELDADRVEFAATNDPVNITHTQVDERWPAWSPTGDLIAFVSDRSGTLQIHVMGTDGSNVRQLTRARDFPAGITRPPMAWSPDGETLTFSARTDEHFDIYALRLLDDATRRLTNSAGDDFSPTYSPTGGRIAFVSSRLKNRKLLPAAYIWMMDADGSNQEHAVTGVGGNVVVVDWSPPLPSASR